LEGDGHAATRLLVQVTLEFRDHGYRLEAGLALRVSLVLLAGAPAIVHRVSRSMVSFV
jgi:hypothetical protein